MINPKEADTLLTVDQTADALHVTRGTLAQWRHHKRYPLAYVKIGSRVLYRVRDVQSFIERRMVGASQAAR